MLASFDFGFRPVPPTPLLLDCWLLLFARLHFIFVCAQSPNHFSSGPDKLTDIKSVVFGTLGIVNLHAKLEYD